MSKAVIVVVEDNAPIRRGVVDSLEFAGYEVRECPRGDKALGMATLPDVDLVLLDVLLPGMDGFAIIEELRRCRPRLPVIMLTAKGSEEDRVRGLKLGADDYVVKPFSARELLARVEAVLRRSAERPSDLRRLSIGEHSFDFDRREVVLPDGVTRQLSETEAGIVRYLAVNRGRAVDRQELLQQVWGYKARGLETRTIDMHISRLREKVELAPDRPEIILTVRSKGYMFPPTPGEST